MNFEELQKAWQSQGHGPQLALDANLLLKEVRRNKWHFEVMLFWRDTREVGVAAGLTVLFLFWGIRDRVWSLNWLALVHRVNIHRQRHVIRQGQRPDDFGQRLAQFAHRARPQHDLVAVKSFRAQQRRRRRSGND
jgi:hypothetical protein